ncbi:CcmD family protein [bacterium]|nr:CcmD family protein [bacterium]
MNAGEDGIYYLFAAYTVIWVLLSVYLFSMSSKQNKLEQEIEQLKKM